MFNSYDGIKNVKNEALFATSEKCTSRFMTDEEHKKYGCKAVEKKRVGVCPTFAEVHMVSRANKIKNL